VNYADQSTTRDSHGIEESRLSHVLPASVLLGVFGALMVLTAITVAVSYVDLGEVNLIVALAVATLKATLVALYFMHLRYDKPFNAIIFVIGVAFLGLFLTITMLDTIEYHPEVQAWEEKGR
jgi:cytochrome c oxidase subunit 4